MSRRLSLRIVLAAAGGLAAAVVSACREIPEAASPQAPAVTPEYRVAATDTLRPGETITVLFDRQGLASPVLSSPSTGDVLDPRRLRAGSTLTFYRRDADTVVSRIVIRNRLASRLAMEWSPAGWLTTSLPMHWTIDTLVFRGTIRTSLYAALTGGDDSRLPAGERIRLGWDLADVFAWEIDFSRDIQTGDQFEVVLERRRSEEGQLSYCQVLAGQLRVRGSEYFAFRHLDQEGRIDFYDGEGNSLRRAFLRAPVQFRRISSRVNAARLHPLLGILRRHEGIDFAANPGTPVMAAADGVVQRREWAGGYGNLLELRHQHGIVTRYGHLQGFAAGIAPGGRVVQGQIIGYVGATGLATGPHLHYEFRVDGVSRDPRTADPGSGLPLAAVDRPEFQRERIELAAMLTGGAPAYVTGEPRPAAAGADF